MVGHLWPLWRLFGISPVFGFHWPVTILEPLRVIGGFSHGRWTLRFTSAFPLTPAKASSVTVIVSRFLKIANGIMVWVLIVTVSSFVHAHIPMLVVDFLINVGSVLGWLLCRWVESIHAVWQWARVRLWWLRRVCTFGFELIFMVSVLTLSILGLGGAWMMVMIISLDKFIRS